MGCLCIGSTYSRPPIDTKDLKLTAAQPTTGYLLFFDEVVDIEATSLRARSRRSRGIGLSIRAVFQRSTPPSRAKTPCLPCFLSATYLHSRLNYPCYFTLNQQAYPPNILLPSSHLITLFSSRFHQSSLSFVRAGILGYSAGF